MTNWGAAEEQGKSTSVSRLKVHSGVKHQGWRLSGLGDFKQKQAVNHMIKSKWKCLTELPCSFTSVFRSLMTLNRGRTPTTTIAIATSLAIHPGEAEAEWMTVTLAFTRGSASVTMAYRSETTQRHTHALETFKTMNRYKHIGLIISDFSYVRVSLHQNASHIQKSRSEEA